MVLTLAQSMHSGLLGIYTLKISLLDVSTISLGFKNKVVNGTELVGSDR